jgi:hypothetical protein
MQRPACNTDVKEAYFIAGEAAFALGDLAKVDQLVALIEELPPGQSSQFAQGHSLRLRARLAALRGDAAEAERLFKRGAARFRELGVPFYRGVTALEQGEWLMGQQRPDDAGPFLEEAQQLFEQLQAAPWQQRTERALGITAVI